VGGCVGVRGGGAEVRGRCQYRSATEKRLAYKPPRDTGDDYLDGFKFAMVPIPRALEEEHAQAEQHLAEKRQREAAAAAAAAETAAAKKAAAAAREEAEEAAAAAAAADPGACLAGAVFALHGTRGHPLDKEALRAAVEGAGGAVAASVTKKVTHVLTSKEAYEQVCPGPARPVCVCVHSIGPARPVPARPVCVYWVTGVHAGVAPQRSVRAAQCQAAAVAPSLATPPPW
jgi:hypothetical protein